MNTNVAVLPLNASPIPRTCFCFSGLQHRKQLFCYHLPGETFALWDETAGYFVSRTAVEPARVECLDDPVAAILRRGAEL
jgi:hypothetical protein